MSQRSHLTSHRYDKSNGIGLPNDKTLSSILQEDKYRAKDAPFIEVFLSFLFCFLLTFFTFLRELLVKLGLRRSRAPKERENKARFTYGNRTEGSQFGNEERTGFLICQQ